MENTWETETDPLQIEEEIFIKDEIINPFKAEFINSKDFHIINQINANRISTINEEEIVLANLPGCSSYVTVIDQTDNNKISTINEEVLILDNFPDGSSYSSVINENDNNQISTVNEEVVVIDNLPDCSSYSTEINENDNNQISTINEEVVVIDNLSDCSTYSDVKKIVDIKKVKVNNSKSNSLHPSDIQILPSSINSVLNNPDKDNSICNCMRYIELYCTKCDYRLFFRKNVSQCFECKTLLKLRCRNCTKRYKYLSSVHQYILQSTKRLNLFENSKKQVTFKCNTVQNYFCSKCTFKTTKKELLLHHTKFTHLTVSNSTSTSISKPASNLVSNPVPHSKSSISNKGQKNLTINGSKNDDQFIEYYCFKCNKAHKRAIYTDSIKQMCQECKVEMSYRCRLCKKTYYKILKHMRNHVRSDCLRRSHQKEFWCSHCDYKIDLKSKLAFHIKTNHEPRECETCSIKFKDAAALKDHKIKGCFSKKERQKTVQTPQDIDMYDSDFEDMINNSKNKSYKIIKNFPRALMKDIIMRPRKNPGWSYYCLQCHKDGQNNFTKYKSKCPECKLKYDYRCIRCDKLYGAYDNMYRHIQLCHSKCPLECSLCDYTNTRRNRILLHIKNRHTVYTCLKCNESYVGYIALGKHQFGECTSENHDGEIRITDTKSLVARYCKGCRKTEYKDDDDSLRCGVCLTTMSYKCLNCNEKFGSYAIAYKHVKEACKPSFFCGKCDYKTHNHHDLGVHVNLTHVDKKSPDCEVQILNETSAPIALQR